MVKIPKINDEEKKAFRNIKKNYRVNKKNYRLNEEGHIFWLDLHKKGLKEIPEIIENFSKLRKLYLHENQISTLTFSDKLQNLEFLLINNNQIIKIKALEGLSKLKALDLSFNQISKIEGLGKLVNLEYLDLSDNEISKIEGLTELRKLKSLDLSKNRISKIEGIEDLPNLEVLDLDKNPLTPQNFKIYAGKNHAQATIKRLKGELSEEESLSEIEKFLLEENKKFNKVKPKIVKRIKELSKISSRIYLSELYEEFKLRPIQIIKLIKELNELGEIKATYYKSTKCFIFKKEKSDEFSDFKAIKCPNCRAPLLKMPPCQCDHCGFMIDVK